MVGTLEPNARANVSKAQSWPKYCTRAFPSLGTVPYRNLARCKADTSSTPSQCSGPQRTTIKFNLDARFPILGLLLPVRGLYGGVHPTGKHIIGVRRGESDTVWGATALTPRNPTLHPNVLSNRPSQETNVPLWYCDVVSLPDPTAEKGVILGRGKNIDASVAEILLVGRRCPGERAPISYGTLPMQKKSTEKSWILRKEKSAARVPRDEVFQRMTSRAPGGSFTVPCQNGE